MIDKHTPAIDSGTGDDLVETMPATCRPRRSGLVHQIAGFENQPKETTVSNFQPVVDAMHGSDAAQKRAEALLHLCVSRTAEAITLLINLPDALSAEPCTMLADHWTAVTRDFESLNRTFASMAAVMKRLQEGKYQAAEPAPPAPHKMQLNIAPETAAALQSAIAINKGDPTTTP